MWTDRGRRESKGFLYILCGERVKGFERERREDALMTTKEREENRGIRG